MKHTVPLALAILAASSLMACSSDNGISDDYSSTEHPIVNGTKVTGNDRLSTVAIFLHGYDINKNEILHTGCTGTLISPRYVLTASHCISDCIEDGKSNGTEDERPYMYIGIGQNQNNFIKTYNIKSFHPHPDFVCNDSEIKNDIAIIELAEDVPRSVAEPSLIIPHSLMPTVEEIDYSPYTMGTTVGFGITAAGSHDSGVKYQTQHYVFAYCTDDFQTGFCQDESIKDYLNKDFIYLTYLSFQEPTSTCNGDSGGPTFFTRNDTDYIVGVTSFGNPNCNSYTAATSVDRHREFIHSIALDANADEPETCDNGIDDNGDGRIDCKDPYCFAYEPCSSEICYNGIDDNDDGKTDCDDPACADHIRCQPETCDNGTDDNEDGLTDCDDPQCADFKKCLPEVCDNNIDDNDNGKTDCDDPECSEKTICIPEICDNGIDENENGLIDCKDPQCAEFNGCIPEICDNDIDDDEDGKKDCDDPACARFTSCLPEICDNDIDDNENGKKDCDDPECESDKACIPEICDNDIDDNEDGKKDCDDPQCKNDDACKSSSSNKDDGSSSGKNDDSSSGKNDDGSSSGKNDDDTSGSKQSSALFSCSANHHSTPAPLAMLLALFGMFGLLIRRRA